MNEECGKAEVGGNNFVEKTTAGNGNRLASSANLVLSGDGCQLGDGVDARNASSLVVHEVVRDGGKVYLLLFGVVLFEALMNGLIRLLQVKRKKRSWKVYVRVVHCQLVQMRRQLSAKR